MNCTEEDSHMERVVLGLRCLETDKELSVATSKEASVDDVMLELGYYWQGCWPAGG